MLMTWCEKNEFHVIALLQEYNVNFSVTVQEKNSSDFVRKFSSEALILNE